jgi:5'-nucleotidase / UDP-sugar diphosphatase
LQYKNQTGANDIIIGFIHGGGIRTGLEAGNITFGDLIQVIPFSNTVDMFELEGKDIRAALENSVIFDEDEKRYNFLQPSGLWYTVDLSKPEGERVTEVLIKNGKKYEALNDDQMYKVVTISFLTNGNDGFTVLRDKKKNLK